MTEKPIYDPINIGTALNIMGHHKDQPRPYAGCPRDREPLIATFERSGAEFLCMVCGGWYGFLAPTPVNPTPDVDARYAELQARFDAGERP